MPPAEVVTSGARLAAPTTSDPMTTAALAFWSPTVRSRSATAPTSVTASKRDGELLLVDGGRRPG